MDSFEYRAQAGSNTLHIFDVENGVRSEVPICGMKIKRPLTLPVDPPVDIEAKGICKKCIERKTPEKKDAAVSEGLR